MTRGDAEASGDSKQRLDILLADYQACREDERVQLATVTAVIGVLVTLVGLMAAAVTQTCEFSSSKSCIQAPDYLLALSPMIPIALLAYAIYFLVLGTLRTYYMRGLESEIRNYSSAPIASLGDLMPASYVGLVQEVTSLRRGRVVYRLIVNLILLIVILIFGGFAAYVAVHLQTVYQVAMSAVYGGIAILFVWQVAEGSIGGRSFFMRAARDFLNNRPGTALPAVRAGEAPSARREGRSLVSYLIFPRPEDWIKWLIAPGVFLAIAWSFGNIGRWRIFIELWLILEYLIYEARYQWNDVRGVDEDSLHSERQARRRLPASPADRARRNVLISLAVAAGRLIAALILAEVLGLSRPVIILIALVFSVAVAYEGLRSLRSPSAQTTPRVVAIWCVVGLGYGIRSGLGLIAGGLPVTSSLAWIGISCFVAFGIMFVLLTWVLEAASSLYRRESDGIWRAKERTVLRPHLTALLRYVPIDPEEWDHDTYSDEEDGSTRAILMKRGRVRTPWNLALGLSAALGGALGVGLAHAAPGYLPDAIAVPASLATAGLLAYRDSQRTRLVVSGIAAVVLVGVIIPFGRWPFDLLAAGPWLMIAATYVMFRGSSYRDLKEFGPDLLKAISSVRVILKFGPGLLRVVIGNKTWLAAGFENGLVATEFVGQLQGGSTGELTIRQSGGPGFFHVSFSGGQVTVGCSSSMSPRYCFDAVGAVASGHQSLLDAMSDGQAFRAVQQHGFDDASLEHRWFSIGTEASAMSELGAHVTEGIPRDFAAIRADIGRSSWQWDDLGSAEWPTRRGFGGCGELAVAEALTDVMARTGDAWVRANFDDLKPRALSFLDKYVV